MDDPSSKNLAMLQASLKQLKESEEVAKDTVAHLAIQREKLKKAKDNIKQSDAELTKANRVVTRMQKRESCVVV